MEEKNVDLKAVSLRLFNPSDTDDFYRWSKTPELYQYINGRPPNSKGEAVNLIQNRIDSPWCKAICVDQKSIGEVSVKWIATVYTSRAEIGFMVEPAYQCRGIATKAVKLASKKVFVEWPLLKRLQAIVAVENVASQRVLVKAGFSKECVLRSYCLIKGNPRDMVMYSLLRSDVAKIK